ncbi:hypothetical protein ACRWQN_16905 [Shewanella sp. HL-SH8]|uniref:hypothetical protein n=1 Tax=Shewanella sp. HL-SH8 TaxID=3436242 RepID=UPI003EBF3958
MFKVKRSRSVIHSVAHHAVSALSWLHPRLGQECLGQNVIELNFDLLNSNITNQNFVASNETKMAFNTLKSTFERIAEAEGVEVNQLVNASISFGFAKDHWPNYCCCSCTSSSGKFVSVKVDGLGNKYGLLSTVRGLYS